MKDDYCLDCRLLTIVSRYRFWAIYTESIYLCDG